jgi:hypothetical protein
MVTATDPIGVIISVLLITCCLLALRHHWKVRNTDAFMWALVAFFLCVDILYKSLQI